MYITHGEADLNWASAVVGAVSAHAGSDPGGVEPPQRSEEERPTKGRLGGGQALGNNRTPCGARQPGDLVTVASC